MVYTIAIIILHLFVILYFTTYYFIFKKKTFDYIYLFLNYILLLQWTFLNGECLISYVFKIIQDNNYIAGEDLRRTEITLSNQELGHITKYINFILNVIVMFNIYMVSKRNKISPMFYISFIFLFEIYYYGNHWFKDHHKNEDFLLFQEVIKYIAIFGGILFIFFMKT